MHPCLCNQHVVVLCRIVQCGLILLTKFIECEGTKIELCWGLDFPCFLKGGQWYRVFVHGRKKIIKNQCLFARGRGRARFALSGISTFSYWRNKCLGKTTWCSKLSLPIRKKINLSMLSSQDGTLINAMQKSLGTKMKLIP